MSLAARHLSAPQTLQPSHGKEVGMRKRRGKGERRERTEASGGRKGMLRIVFEIRCLW